MLPQYPDRDHVELSLDLNMNNEHQSQLTEDTGEPSVSA